MRWISVARWWTVGALVVLQAPLQAQTTAVPVSLDHIRAALTEPPPALQLTAASGERPTFRVEVRQPVWTLLPVEERPFDPTYGLPSVGELLMDGVEKIRVAVLTYKRDRKERRARREVEDALAALCAVRDCSVAQARE